MFLPLFSARVKQGDILAGGGIERGRSVAFVAVAPLTGKRQILMDVITSFTPGLNVLDTIW
jgi:hypothetical protein